MANSISWQKIFDDYDIQNYDFKSAPFVLTADQIKKSCQNFTSTAQKEVRILCKQDTREQRPEVFKKNNLFLLPVKNGVYNIIKGEGYFNIPPIKDSPTLYTPKIDFELETVSVGNSEMQHLDFAYAISIIRTFMQDDSLILTIRGRKYTPKFEFNVGDQKIITQSVQTEVDAGYEGKNKVALIEAKNSTTKNTIIRQLYYPYRQWQEQTTKKVETLFFERRNNIYNLWLFEFTDKYNYNSIKLIDSRSFILKV